MEWCSVMVRVSECARAVSVPWVVFGRGRERDVVSYSASISDSEKGSQRGEAWALQRDMCGRRLEWNVVSYNASISSSEKGSQ